MRWWKRRKLEQDLERELRDHLNFEIAEQEESGLPAEEARYSALRAFGNTTLVKEQIYEMAAWTRLEIIWQDLRFAACVLRKNPAFATAAILTLALGIGANTAIFSVVNSVLLRPLPYPDPEKLVTIWESAPQGRMGGARTSVSPVNFLDWSKDNSLFSNIGAWQWDVVTVTGEPMAERVWVQLIAGGYLRALGFQPALGRAFLPQEERPGHSHVVLLSDRLWRRRFGADPSAVSRAIAIDGVIYQIVGVMPENFRTPTDPGHSLDLWMPLAFDAALATNRAEHRLSVIARLAPGVAVEQAQSRLEAKARQIAAAFPATNRDWGVHVVRLKDEVVGSSRTVLLVLAGAVGFLLLIACTNVANLLLARAAAQRREIAIRAALGAGPWRLIAQFLAQSLLLAGMGGLGGLLVCHWATAGLLAIAPGVLPRMNETSIDWRVLSFTAALALATALAFGLAPALGQSKPDLHAALKSREGALVGHHNGMRNALVAGEVALAFLLLTGAGLLIRSFQAIRAVDLGFRTANVLAVNVGPLPGRYPDPRQYAEFFAEMLSRVQTAPGVISAAVTLGVPLRGSAGGGFDIYGRQPEPNELFDAEFRPVSDGYLATLGIPVISGRGFNSRDVDGGPPVAVINQTLARRFFSGQDPIGKQIRRHGPGNARPWMTVVGVVGNTRHVGPLKAPLAEIYVPFLQYRNTNQQPKALLVRSGVNPETLLPAIQRAVSSVDKDMPIFDAATLEHDLSGWIAPQRFDTTLFTIFASLGLGLAIVGIFGVMSYLVTRRTHEIGIRMALGAAANHVAWTVVREGIRVTAVGLVIGLAAAWGLTRFLKALLFSVTPTDPITLITVSVAMLLSATAASYIPARRASKVDPLVALREE